MFGKKWWVVAYDMEGATGEFSTEREAKVSRKAAKDMGMINVQVVRASSYKEAMAMRPTKKEEE